MNDEITPAQMLILLEELLSENLITRETARNILMGTMNGPTPKPAVTLVRKKRT